MSIVLRANLKLLAAAMATAVLLLTSQPAERTAHAARVSDLEINLHQDNGQIQTNRTTPGL